MLRSTPSILGTAIALLLGMSVVGSTEVPTKVPGAHPIANRAGAPVRLADLALDRAFHTVIQVTPAGPYVCPLPASIGVAITEISGIPHWDRTVLGAAGNVPFAYGFPAPFRLKIYVDEVLTISRHVKGSDSRQGSFAFDPPLLIRPGQVLRIAFEPGPLLDVPPFSVPPIAIAGDSAELTVSGWVILPGEV